MAEDRWSPAVRVTDINLILVKKIIWEPSLERVSMPRQDWVA